MGCGAAGVLSGVLLNIADSMSPAGAVLNTGRVGCCRARGDKSSKSSKTGAQGTGALLLSGADEGGFIFE